MFKQRSRRISMVVGIALGLLLLLITLTTGQVQVAQAKTEGGRDLQQTNAHHMQSMTDTMPITGTMHATSAMPMTGMMDMGKPDMAPMMGMMSTMHSLMMQHMQSMMAACPDSMPATGTMTMTGMLTNTMPMTDMMDMGTGTLDQMMQSMMGMGTMTHTMPMTDTMMGEKMQMMGTMMQMMGLMPHMMSGDMGTMTHPMPMTTTLPMGEKMQMMGLMLQMMGQMQGMIDAGASTISNTMPMRVDMCPMMGMMNQMMQTMGSHMEPFDLRFIDGMIMHHQSAIEMAKEAQTQATKPESKALADTIIAAQEAEIAQMQDWRQAWYPDAAPTEGLSMDMGTMAVAQGDELYDLRFIAAMIPHHEGAIAMAKEALTKAEHEEIKTLAETIITAQEDEIAQMKEWQAAWSSE